MRQTIVSVWASSAGNAMPPFSQEKNLPGWDSVQDQGLSVYLKVSLSIAGHSLHILSVHYLEMNGYSKFRLNF